MQDYVGIGLKKTVEQGIADDYNSRKFTYRDFLAMLNAPNPPKQYYFTQASLDAFDENLKEINKNANNSNLITT